MLFLSSGETRQRLAEVEAVEVDSKSYRASKTDKEAERKKQLAYAIAKQRELEMQSMYWKSEINRLGGNAEKIVQAERSERVRGRSAGIVAFSQQSEILGDGSSDTDNRGGSRGGAFEIKNEEKMNDTMEKGLQKADNTKLSGDAIGVTRRHRKR